MPDDWTANRFPAFESAIRELTEQHRKLTDEPLHLAVSYQPGERNQQHIYLFEVIGGSTNGEGVERDLFETTFTATPGFPMQPNEQLHLILTSLHELEIALREGWPLAAEIVGAIHSGDYQVLYVDDVGRQALAALQSAAPQEVVRG
jgi:hypothetical protein